ncbi:MAG: FkbM family methyltransferase [Lacipirellulaceae bacterium]
MSLSRLFKRREKVPFAQWGSQVSTFELPQEGSVDYAQWLHPYETTKSIDQSEIDGLKQFIRPGDFAIDIGAHTGDTTVPMALAAGKQGCVLALEPNPYVFEILKENAGLNLDKTHIVPQCLAATEHDGNFVFHYSDASFCNGGFRSQQRWPLFRRKHALKVKGRILANLLRDEFAGWLPKLAYVKVDAEGYDCAILKSILPILLDTRPVIRTEVFRKLLASERRELFDLLADNGFEVFRYEGGESPQGASISREKLTAEKHFDILAVPRAEARNQAA